MSIRNIAIISAYVLTFIIQGMLSGNCAEEDESVLFWPPPPAEMRIAFVKSIYEPADVGIKPGFFKKLKRIITGNGKEALNKPISVAVDEQKAIYACDAAAPAVYIFRQKEREYKKITKIKEEELLSPVGVAAGDGLIFISDSKLKKVFCLDKNGRFKFTIGEGAGLLRPTGLAIVKEKLYVADTAAHAILVFGLDGTLVARFGKRGTGKGEFNYPTAIAADKEDRTYIVDTLNFRIQVFDADNNFLYAIGEQGDGSGSFSRPKGVALDSFGHIYATDGVFDNIQIFSAKAEFLLALGESGNKEGEFWIPSGIAIDKENYIYVADSYNQRIQVFRYVGRD